jgi:hypothetical protein
MPSTNRIFASREEIEKYIIEKGIEVNVSKPQGEWLNDEEFESFLDAWSILENYYSEHNDDAVIGIEVLREYLHFTRLLRNLMLYHELSDEQLEQAKDAIESLEFTLEEIITEVVSYLDDLERSNHPKDE